MVITILDVYAWEVSKHIPKALNMDTQLAAKMVKYVLSTARVNTPFSYFIDVGPNINGLLDIQCFTINFQPKEPLKRLIVRMNYYVVYKNAKILCMNSIN